MIRFCKHKYLLLIFFFTAYITSCKSSSDKSEIQPTIDKPSEYTKVNKFVWDIMDGLYLWRDKMPSSVPDSALNPNQYFEKLTFREKDRWSLLVSEYQKLVNEIEGIKKAFGLSLYPMLLSKTGDEVVAVVMYVYPNTPASEKGLKRGDIVTKVNGNPLNKTNYQKLLSENTMNLNLGKLSGNRIKEQKDIISISKREIKINPILEYNVIEKEGKKIGYLNYMSFIPEYDDELEGVFENFKAQGVEELILDLRYNGGGDMVSAIKLGSMIAPSSALDKVFLNKIWNNVLTSEFKSRYKSDNRMFQEKFIKTKTNLNLSRLYVITSSGTASASELIINSLRPYMNVVTIGERTHGKYVASSIFSDEKKEHDWAVMPIIFKVSNVNGETDYGDGFEANIKILDDFHHQLGNEEESCFKAAINNILGIQDKELSVKPKLRYLKNPKLIDETSIYLKNTIIDTHSSSLLGY